MERLTSVGLSKKHGLPDFGSVGASCNVTVELEGSLLHQDLETFQRHVRKAYVACSQAVNDELLNTTRILQRASVRKCSARG